MTDKKSAKVLRVAVIVDGESCEELRQTEPGDIYISRASGDSLSVGPSLDIETGVAAEGPQSAQTLPKILMLVGLVMVLIGVTIFAREVNEHVIENAALVKGDPEAKPEEDPTSTIALVIALGGVVPLVAGASMLRGRRRRRRQELTVYDGWARPKDHRKGAPIWLGVGVLLVLAGGGLFAYEVDRHTVDVEITDATRGDMSAYKPDASEGTGGLGMLILLIGLVPLVTGVVGLSEEPVKPPKRAPKGAQAPRMHRLFAWVEAEGVYYIDIPPETKGKIALGSNKATVDQLRKRFAQGDRLRVKLGDKAKGKLLIGQSRIMFQTAKPAREAAKPPFPAEYIDPLAHLRLSTLDTYTFGGAAVVALAVGIWFAYFSDRTPSPPAERFLKEMGIPASFYEEEKPEEEEAEEQDALTQKDEEKEEEKEDEKEIEEQLDEKLTKPENISDEAFNEARGVGVALTLGTYGGPGEGTVLDMIQSHENNLGDLFAQGMATTEESRGGPIGEFVAGGGGIDATGTVKSNEGIKTGEGPAEVGTTQKKERKVVAKSSTEDVVGDVDKQSVSATIRRRMPGLEACYEKALRSNPNLKGKVTYTITINPSGRVTDVDIEEDTVGDASVRSCTEAKIKAWRFLTEGAEDSSEVTFSVSFTG